MKSNTSTSAARVISLLLLASATSALAQVRTPMHFTGLINDYSPLSTSVKGSPMGDARSMVDGSQPLGNRRLLSGYDDVRLWENHGRCCRSDAAPGEPSHPPHQVDERQDHLGHDWMPHLPNPRPHPGLSVERHGQPDDREWTDRPIRDGPAFIDAAGLRHRRARGLLYGSRTRTLRWSSVALRLHISAPQALHGVVRLAEAKK